MESVLKEICLPKTAYGPDCRVELEQINTLPNCPDLYFVATIRLEKAICVPKTMLANFTQKEVVSFMAVQLRELIAKTKPWEVISGGVGIFEGYEDNSAERDANGKGKRRDK